MVKKRLSTLQLIAILFVVAGWAIALLTMVNGNGKKEQRRLVEEAQRLVSEKLYMPAAELYEQALDDYSTDQNPEIEIELLQVYKDAGKTEEYMDLVEDRISDGTTTVEEYIALADIHLNNGSVRGAIAVLKNGVESTEDETVIKKYESIRYERSEREAAYQQVVQAESSLAFPVTDGTKWGYADYRGKLLTDFTFDEALAFSGDYSVVKQDGEYRLINSSGDLYGRDKSALNKVADLCEETIAAVKGGKYALYTKEFVPVTEHIYDDIILGEDDRHFVKESGVWKIMDEEGKEKGDNTYLDVPVNSLGQAYVAKRAVVKDENGYFVIRANGKEASKDEVRFADAKAIEEEDSLIAVANSAGKWGFVNEDGELVIDYKFSDAKSFSCGLAAVKTGAGWSYINLYGDVVIRADYDQANPFRDGSALVNDGGIYKIITLKFYE
ncbi:MAG: WG repeat-containing protein [Oscillospiraceae bacterium]|nr:WG repeat-containing protein [Oscillospiraceae bacterium]